MKKRSTLADVAKIANVSMMTASRAINGKPGLSEDLRERILEIAANLGYRPNIIARGLATSKTCFIGLIVPDITNPFFGQIVRGVENAAFENGYNLFLVDTNEDLVRETSALDSLWQNDIDGLILCSSRLPEADLISQINRFPAVVLVNRELQENLPNLTTINLNDFEGAQIATRYFLQHNRKHVGYIGGPLNSVSNQRRLSGFLNVLKTSGNVDVNNFLDDNVPDTNGGWLAALNLLIKNPNLDAVFAFNDLMAVGAMQALQEVGKRIPEEIAIIGVDDIPLATIIHPQLSTLHVDLQNIGKVALQSLLNLVSDSPAPTNLIIDLELFLRDSS
jgi:LacI family transcriptional regulator